MKNKFLMFLTAALAACTVFTTTACADFAKSKTYTDGQFTDVPATEWYAESVKDAFEYGIMNGDSATTFNPAGTLTVAEGITIASRINETLTGVKIPAGNGGEWYQMYVDYAIANGIMTAEQFDSYDLNIKRFEIAELLAKVAGDLPAANNVTKLPDVASGVSYAPAVLKLYNAGILGGNDEYGTFAPNSYLLRSEISAMAVRIADSAKRVKKDFVPVEARAFTDSYYIIENVWGSLNGWGYDNRFDLYNISGAKNASLTDVSDEQFFALNRDFDPESEGILRLELSGNYSSSEKGAYIALQNADAENVLEITPVGGVWTLIGTNSISSAVAIDEINKKYYSFVIEIDLDKNTAFAIINNQMTEKVSIADDAVLTRLVIGSNKVGVATVQKDHARMSKNYPLDENFFSGTTADGQKPAGWDVTGDFVLEDISSVLGQDIRSLKAESAAGAVSTAKKNFEPVTGKVVMEAYVLFPEKSDGGSVAFTSAGNEVFKFETKNGKIVMGEKELHDYTANVWQWLYVEADTALGKAVVKVNGKERATVDFNAKIFDGVSIAYAPTAAGVMWVDDLEAYTLIDHADYPAYPQVAESTDYNVGINVCYLWRDIQSGEGWDAVSPFPEFDTYLGFYDEGLRETADWELKWMAEHGIDFMHVCWYCPYGDQKAPIKKMRVSHSALNDGYMNAKYSDLVDFCIMWENNSQDIKSFEQFKEFIWPYWKEYYFSDERYARLDNKAVLTVWNKDKMKAAFGGTNEGCAEAVKFMEDELKAMGYDGLILLYQTQGETNTTHYTEIGKQGFDGTYGYHWGTNGWNPDHQINANTKNANYSKNASSHHIPTISIGFNDVGRNNTRDKIITGEDHLKVAENIKEILSTYNTGTWKDNTVMVSTWNEYSEGTYVMPTDEMGFTYLENIRKVFTNDTSDHTALDVKPTKTQIDRVGHMYAPNFSPIRWFQFEKASSDVAATGTDSLSPVVTYDMKAGGAKYWENQFGITTYSEENGVISGTTANVDYAIKTSADFEGISAKDAPIIHIRMKASAPKSIEVFFLTDTDSKWEEKKRKQIPQTVKDEYADYYINMSSVEGWTGTITAVRIDPMNNPGSFEIDLIEFMNYKSASETAPRVKVNGAELEFVFDPNVLSDGDYEVVGEMKRGFYSALRLYYEWDRFTDDGILTLKTFDEHTYVFKINSDKVLVDGVEKSLGYTLKQRDGMPVFQMKKLAELLGYKVKMNGSTMEVQAATDAEYAALNSRVENQWEFNLAGMTEGFTAQHGAVSVGEDGFLTFTPTGSDVAVIKSVKFAADTYTHIVVGIELTDPVAAGTAQLFFTTATSSSWTGDKGINAKADIAGKKKGDIVEITFNLRDNAKFAGNITGIRIDPFNMKGEFKIDYIRCERRDVDASADELIPVEDLAWTFDDDGDTMGWAGQNSTVAAKGGYLDGTCTASDIAVINNSVNFNVADAQVVVVGVKYNPSYCNGSAELFFKTDRSNAYSGDKRISAKYVVPAFTNEGETVEVAFDLTGNSKFISNITGIRVDLHGGIHPYSVDYIKLYKNPSYDPGEAPEMVINKPTMPTEVVITDPANLPEGVKTSAGGAASIEIVDDPENAGQKVFKVKCIKAGDQYTYLYVHMNFVAGKKYNVSYKIYPLKNMNGDDFKDTIIGGNFVYGTDGEAVSNHTFDSGTNKSSGKGWITVNQTVEISSEYNPAKNDHFETWGKFSGGAGVEYLVKDISITLAK